LTKQLTKYLNSRAASSPWALTGLSPTVRFRAALVIPALAERQVLPATLAALAANPRELLCRTLIVIVVNNRAVACIEDKRNNQQTLAWLEEHSLGDFHMTWVDASSSGVELGPKEGVGLARKIGFDLALPHLDWEADPILISLDADTLVDANYLAAIFTHFEERTCGGAVIPFRHQPGQTERQEKAIRTYELYLRSYLLGLHLAGSPYAYHTIGSALACRASAYVAAGGMNRRSAAEDFYFLQQLAKVAGVETLSGTVVQPSPRFSHRVPFGTGKAVQAQVDEDKQLFVCSSGRAFQLLKDWLELISSNLGSPAESVLMQAGAIAPELQDYLIEYEFDRIWTRFQRQHGGSGRQVKAFHDWFDALKTRQLVSRFDRDTTLTSGQRIEGVLALAGYAKCCDFDRQLALLERLQLGLQKDQLSCLALAASGCGEIRQRQMSSCRMRRRKGDGGS